MDSTSKRIASESIEGNAISERDSIFRAVVGGNAVFNVVTGTTRTCCGVRSVGVVKVGIERVAGQRVGNVGCKFQRVAVRCFERCAACLCRAECFFANREIGTAQGNSTCLSTIQSNIAGETNNRGFAVVGDSTTDAGETARRSGGSVAEGQARRAEGVAAFRAGDRLSRAVGVVADNRRAVKAVETGLSRIEGKGAAVFHGLECVNTNSDEVGARIVSNGRLERIAAECIECKIAGKRELEAVSRLVVSDNAVSRSVTCRRGIALSRVDCAGNDERATISNRGERICSEDIDRIAGTDCQGVLALVVVGKRDSLAVVSVSHVEESLVKSDNARIRFAADCQVGVDTVARNGALNCISEGNIAVECKLIRACIAVDETVAVGNEANAICARAHVSQGTVHRLQHSILVVVASISQAADNRRTVHYSNISVEFVAGLTVREFEGLAIICRSEAESRRIDRNSPYVVNFRADKDVILSCGVVECDAVGSELNFLRLIVIDEGLVGRVGRILNEAGRRIIASEACRCKRVILEACNGIVARARGYKFECVVAIDSNLGAVRFASDELCAFVGYSDNSDAIGISRANFEVISNSLAGRQ